MNKLKTPLSIIARVTVFLAFLVSCPVVAFLTDSSVNHSNMSTGSSFSYTTEADEHGWNRDDQDRPDKRPQLYELINWWLSASNHSEIPALSEYSVPPPMDLEGFPMPPPSPGIDLVPVNKSEYIWITSYQRPRETYHGKNITASLTEAFSQMQKWFSQIPDISEWLIDQVVNHLQLSPYSTPQTNSRKKSSSPSSSTYSSSDSSTSSSGSTSSFTSSSSGFELTDDSSSSGSDDDGPPPEDSFSDSSSSGSSQPRGNKRRNDDYPPPPPPKKRKRSEKPLPKAHQLPSGSSVKRSQAHRGSLSHRGTPAFIARANQYVRDNNLLRALYALSQDYDLTRRRFNDCRTHKFAEHLVRTVTDTLHDAKKLSMSDSSRVYETHRKQLANPELINFILKLKHWHVDILHSMATLGMRLGDRTRNPLYYREARLHLEPIKHTNQSMRVLLMLYQAEKMYEEERSLAIKYLNSTTESIAQRRHVEAHLISALLKQNQIAEVVALILPVLGRSRTAFIFGLHALEQAKSIPPAVSLTSTAEGILTSLTFRDTNLLRKLIAILLQPKKQNMAMLRKMLESYTSSGSFAHHLVDLAQCSDVACTTSETGLVDRASIAFILFRQMAGMGAFDAIQQLAEHLPEIIPAPESSEYQTFMAMNQLSTIRASLVQSLPQILFSSEGQKELRKGYTEFEHHLRRAIVLRRACYQRTDYISPDLPQPAIEMRRRYQKAGKQSQHMASLKTLLHQQFVILPDSDDEESPEALIILSEVHRLLAMVTLNELEEIWQRFVHSRM